MGELGEFSRARLRTPDELAGSAPAVLYVLTDPGHGGPEVSSIAGDPHSCVWLYTSVPLLVESCGDGQPYMALSTEQLAELTGSVTGAFWCAVDMRRPESARCQEPDWQEFDPLQPLESVQAQEPLVWIPTRPIRSGDHRVTAELHGTKPGEKLLLIYDSPRQAWQACGPYQPLAAIHLDDVNAVARECGAEQVVAGAVLTEDARYKAPVQERARPREDEFRTGEY